MDNPVPAANQVLVADQTTTPQSPLAELKRLCELPDVHGRTLRVATFCRDKLGWAMHPLRGPSGGEEPGRGKGAIIKSWPIHTVEQTTDDYLYKHLGNGHDYNLGIVVRGNHVCVDLDSKADKGQSVLAWIDQHPELAKVPRERTAGGVHLHFKCSNLPAFTKNGKPYRHALVSKLSEQVTAELYFDGLNLVTAPSIHPSGVTYTWEVVGDIPEVTWEQLMEWFRFELPDKAEPQLVEDGKQRKKNESDKWWHKFRGDMRTLNLEKLFESVNRLGKDLGEGKFAVHCPWHEEHSDGTAWKTDDGSTVILTACKETKFPTFKCLHAHCAERGLKDALEWFEKQTPGIVDQNCARTWAYARGQQSEDGRPQIPLPGDDRPESEFATEVGEILAPKEVWFLKLDEVVVVRLKKFSERVRHLGFCRMEPAEVRTAIETFIQTGLLRGKIGKEFFVPKSMDMTMAKTLISARQFKDQLPEVVRILDVQLPIRYNGEIVLPKKGYDPRFNSYCDLNAPEILKMTLEEAKRCLAEIYQGFCWRGAQDLVHALARLITPYCRGLMGWDARFPLWFFKANRPRAGKDYLAGISMLVYEGFACEDAPLSPKNSEETRKRITSALLSGRRMIHFANCQGYLASQDLEQAVTSRVWGDRVLGGNTEVKLPNELEFSLSANLGLSYPEDIEPRLRIIELGYPQEDANSRTFPIPHLHDYVRQHRSEILSAIAALVENWIQKGCPAGPTPFTSFPEWGRTVGGIMVAVELGDPCLPHEHKPDVGGDQLTRAMKELFLICRQARPDDWLKKNEIYELIEQNQADCEALAFFGDLSEANNDRSAKTKLGKNLIVFENRELGQIRMERQGSGDSGRTDRASFRFVKIDEPGKDQGDKIAESVFRGTQLPLPPSPHGDLGDLGDLSHSVIIKTITNGERGKQEEGGNIYTVAGGAGKTPQGLQGLHATSEVRTVLTSLDDLQVVASAIREAGGPVVLDIETYGPKRGDSLKPFKGEIRLLTLAAGEQGPWLFDLKAVGYDLGPLKPVLEESEVIGHHLKFDALWLKVKCGVSLNRVFCTMTASRLLTAGTEEENDLGECLRRHLHVDLPKDQGKSDWGATVLSPEQLRYAAEDVLFLGKLKVALLAEIEKNNLGRVCALEQSLLPVVVGIEARGIAVDAKKLALIREKAEHEQQEAITAVQQFVGDPDFNPGSVQQLQSKFKERGVNLPNTEKETLLGCKDQLAAEILKFKAPKTRALQAQSLLDSIGDDGRIHASFNPLGAKTGRFSTSEPSLQNISRGELRECFVAGPGNVLVVADYSQIELRAAAAIAEDEKMRRAYNEHADLHTQTASLVKGKPEEAIEKPERQLAKAVNFGLLYGQSANGLVKYAKGSYGVELTEQEATQFRARFFDSYQGLAHWHESARRQADQNCREVRTRTGRRQLLPQGRENWWARFVGLLNTVVQGSCADGLKMAMVELSKRLPSDAGIVSTVHDELIVEVPEGKSEEVKKLLEQCMVEKMRELFPEVPIEVELKICRNWGEK